MKFEDFEIVIDRTATLDRFSVNVSRPCGRNTVAKSDFSLEEIVEPGQQGDLAETVEGRRRDIEVIGGDDQDADRYSRVDSTALAPEAAGGLGARLSAALFKNDIRDILQSCREGLGEGQGLRVRLNLFRVPELANLPWEYLRLPGEGAVAVALDSHTGLVRYVEAIAASVPSLRIRLPLRVLLVTANPSPLPRLNLEEEIRGIQEKLGQNVTIVPLKNATIDTLTQELSDAVAREQPFHILHFSGHGAFDKTLASGVLLFDDGNNKPAAVTGEALGLVLQPFNRDLRLVLLNACEGAVHSISNIYSSVAARVMQIAGLPAAVAMQYKITDKAAIEFATALYRDLVQGGSLERAVRSARVAVLALSAGPANDWATPVLYLRAQDGDLFDVRIPKVPESLTGHYSAVTRALPTCELVFFLGLNVNSIDRPTYDAWEPSLGLPTSNEIRSYLRRKFRNLPPETSLAGIAQWLELKGTNLNDEFIDLFAGGPTKLQPKLYEILSGIAKIVTGGLMSGRTKKTRYKSLLFITTTYDQTLETAFERQGLSSYHILTYGRSQTGSYFTHTHHERQPDYQGQPDYSEAVVAKLGPFEKKANEYANWRDDAGPAILKLPGEIRSDALANLGSSTFAVAEDDFFSFASTHISSLVPPDILSQIKECRHLYLGYDVQNWSIRLLWDLLCGGQVPRGSGSYAVVRDSPEDLDSLFWRKFDVQLAAAELDDYVKGLETMVLDKL